MEHGALTVPVQAPKYQTTLAWLGCASLCMAGIMCIAASSSAATNNHVRMQSTVRQRLLTHAPQVQQQSLRDTASAPVGKVDLQAAATNSDVPGRQASVQSHLPLTTAFVGFVAAIVTAWKYFHLKNRNAATWSAAASLGEIMGMAKKSEEKKSEKLGMDQVALAIKEEQTRSKTMTPKEVVLELQRGNARFWSGMPDRPEMNAMERRALIMAQAPMVCILSCADSRVPVEILFDQGLGRVFVVRVAGNILDPTAMGSIEFSVKYLGVKVVLVMGHEACGAVKGAMTMSNDDIDKQPAYLQTVLRSIRSNLDLDQLKKMRDSRAQDRQAIVTNTYAQVKSIQENKLIAERIGNGSLLVCGAFYEITSGMVDFFTLDKNGLVIDI